MQELSPPPPKAPEHAHLYTFLVLNLLIWQVQRELNRELYWSKYSSLKEIQLSLKKVNTAASTQEILLCKYMCEFLPVHLYQVKRLSPYQC